MPAKLSESCGNTVICPYIDKAIITRIDGGYSPDSTISALVEALGGPDTFSLADHSPSATGLFLGTSLSNFHIRNDNFQKFSLKGLRVMNPANAPKGLISYIGGQLSIKLNIKGVQSTVSTNGSKGYDALSQGLYYLARNKRNCIIVIELDEYIKEGPECFVSSGCILILKNNDPLTGSGQFTHLLGMESFFEKQNNNKGLIKALEKVTDNYNLDLKNINSIYLSGASTAAEVSLAKEALNSIKGLREDFPVQQLRDGESPASGLFLISRMINGGKLSDPKDETKDLNLVLHLGSGANSSCLALSVKERGKKDE